MGTSDGGIILPGDLPAGAMDKLGQGKRLTPQEQAQAKQQEEADALDRKVEDDLNLKVTQVAGAKICPLTGEATPRPYQMETLQQIVNLPAWARPRCIGAACHLFVGEAQECGLKLQGLLAWEQLKALRAKAAGASAPGVEAAEKRS